MQLCTTIAAQHISFWKIIGKDFAFFTWDLNKLKEELVHWWFNWFVHFFIDLFICRSSFIDAKKAIQLKADYEKAAFRMAQCSFHLKKYEECIDLCNKYIDKYGQSDKCLELRKKARETHLQVLRDERKKQNEHRRKGETLKRTIDELKARGIKFEEQLASSAYEDLIRPTYIPLEEYPIQISEDGMLRWPAIFCYPEFEICDFQQQLHDNNT